MHPLALVLVLLAQTPDFSKVKLTVTKVAGTVHMIEGMGGNIGVSVGEDGIVVVDDEFAPLVPKIQQALKPLSKKPVKFILNTHWHGDHTGGNEGMAKGGTPIIAHENVRKRLTEGSEARKIPAAPKGALPVVTFKDALSLHINGEEVRALHLPAGHTDGDVVVLFTQSNVAHLGDHFFNGHFPFIDLDSGGTVKGYIANVERLLKELPADAKLIPGHGPLATHADLQAFAEMLRGCIAVVEAGIKAGKSVETLKQEKVLAKWDSFASQFVTTDKFIETLHRDLSRK
jgi:cyclase